MSNPEHISKIKQVVLEHWNDVDGGYSLVDRIRRFMKSLNSNEYEDVIDYLLKQVLDINKEVWGVALEVLVQENSSRVAPILGLAIKNDDYLPEWKDHVILGLLRLNWQNDVNYISEYIETNLNKDRIAVLPILAALCNVSQNKSIMISAKYFANKLITPDNVEIIEGYIPCFVRNFIEKDEKLLSKLVSVTKLFSLPAAINLKILLLNYISKPFVVKEYGSDVIKKIKTDLDFINLRGGHPWLAGC